MSCKLYFLFVITSGCRDVSYPRHDDTYSLMNCEKINFRSAVTSTSEERSLINNALTDLPAFFASHQQRANGFYAVVVRFSNQQVNLTVPNFTDAFSTPFTIYAIRRSAAGKSINFRKNFMPRTSK